MPSGSQSHRSTKLKAPARRSKTGRRIRSRSTKMKAPVRRKKIVRKPQDSTTITIHKKTANGSHYSDDFRASPYGPLSMEQENDYYTQICPAMAKWRKEKFLCDVTLVSKDDVKIYAHKMLLIGVSQFFLAKFKSFDGNRVLLQKFDSLTLESLVNYAYNKNDITIDDNNVEAILEAADYLGMIALTNLCSNYLSSKICVLNFVHIRSIAVLYSCKSLLNSCDDFMKKCFTKVVKIETFLDFPSDLLLKIIQDDDLDVFSEMIVYNAVMKWLKHDWENRQKFLYELMRHVRLPFVGRDRLFRIFRSDFANITDQILKLEVQQLFWNALEEENSHSASSLVISNKYESIPRVSYTSIPKMFVIGGANKRTSHATVDCFDIRSTKKLSVTQLSEEVYVAAAVSTLNKIYVTDDYKMKIFDMKVNMWIANENLPFDRSNYGLALLDNKIYVIGGRDESGVPFNSVWCYSLEEKRWHNASDMMEGRESATAAVLNGMIYVVGGNQIPGDWLPGDSVEFYDPATSTWNYCKRMNHARAGAAATVVDNLLYVLGGDDDGNFGNRFEVYDPVTDEWELMPNLPAPRMYHGVCHDNGYLFVVGGDWNGSCISRIDVFCLFTREWYETGLRLDVPRRSAAVVMAYESPN